MSYYEEWAKTVGQHWVNGGLDETGENEKFGFWVGQRVRIIADGEFKDQETEVIGFTRIFVVVNVSGPVGEPGSEWWIPPEGLEPIDRFLAA